MTKPMDYEAFILWQHSCGMGTLATFAERRMAAFIREAVPLLREGAKCAERAAWSWGDYDMDRHAEVAEAIADRMDTLISTFPEDFPKET